MHFDLVTSFGKNITNTRSIVACYMVYVFTGVGLLVVTFDWRFARLIAPVVTTTSIILSCNKIHPERERERERERGEERDFTHYS